MNNDFASMLAAAPPGGTVDLGSAGRWIGLEDAPVGARFRRPVTVTGDGAVLALPHSGRMDRAALAIRAADVRLVGDVTVVCPDEARRDDLEFQHGVRLEGAVRPVIGWKFRNQQGTGVYMGKDPTRAPGTGWCRDVTLTDTFQSVNAGRQHIALQAVDGFLIDSPYMDTCGQGHSSIVFEPNGHDWGCRNGLIRRPTFVGNTGFCFGALGLGDFQPHRNLENVRMLAARSEGPFSVRVVHGIGNRRGPGLRFESCRGGGVANHPVIRCSGVDGLVVLALYQRAARGVDLFDLDGCPDAIADAIPISTIGT